MPLQVLLQKDLSPYPSVCLLPWPIARTASAPAVDMPQLRVLKLMRLGARMLPRSLSRLLGLTRLAFSGEMMRSVQLHDELLQLTNLKVRVYQWVLVCGGAGALAAQQSMQTWNCLG